MEYLRVFGEEQDVATVFQQDGENKNFRLFPIPVRRKKVTKHNDGVYARFMCTRGENYGFREAPLYIILKTKYGTFGGPVAAGGTFGIKAQRDPENWGFNTWDQGGETFEVASNDDGSEKERTPPLPGGGYAFVAVRTQPDALDVVNAYLKGPGPKVNVRWEMNSRFVIYWRYKLATADAGSAVSAKAKFRLASTFPGFPEEVKDERWSFNFELDGTWGGLPCVWSPWLVKSPSVGEGYPEPWYFVKPEAPAFWPLYEPNYNAITDDAEEDPLTLKAKGIDLEAQEKSQLEMFLDGAEFYDSPVDVRLYVDFPF